MKFADKEPYEDQKDQYEIDEAAGRGCASEVATKAWLKEQGEQGHGRVVLPRGFQRSNAGRRTTISGGNARISIGRNWDSTPGLDHYTATTTAPTASP